MCGFAGYLRPDGFNIEHAAAVVEAMAVRLIHRGPDDGGVWVDGRAGIALAHRRLAVVDLSPAGRQPMISSCGRFVLVFNGEIYNHAGLRRELASATPFLSASAGDISESGRWRGHSDTETMLAAIAAWGVATALGKCVGMFAFALWDRKTRILTLARDRMGEKPLYYGRQGKSFLFGSELKSLTAHPEFSSEVDRDSLAALLLLNCVPGTSSIYRGIRKLPPGTFLQIGDDGEMAAPVPYWSLAAAVTDVRQNSFAGDEQAAVLALKYCLGEAIADQMVADVPVGVFLSGGVDSSLVTALMQARSSIAVRSFSIGFHEEGYDEARYAAKVAAHLGTDHTEFHVPPADALAIIPSLPVLYDEPFADSSQIPTALVSRLARGRVTVALTGDGGDELFGGYYRYLWAASLWGRIKLLPFPLRRLVGRLLAAVPDRRLGALMRFISALLPVAGGDASADRLRRWAGRLSRVKDMDDLYWSLLFTWEATDGVVKGAGDAKKEVAAAVACPPLLTGVERMMFLDAVTYLSDDILVKVDRAAMASSLETRVPLLDHRVVEFAWRLPLAMKIRRGRGKWLPRRVLAEYVPDELIERPKMGFGIPLAAWLRGPLREWAESLLAEERLEREGFFHPAPIRKKWREHLSERHDRAAQLWSVLMFQAWLENNH